MNDLLVLTKVRITLLVLVTAGVGFILGSPAGVDAWRLVEVLFGIAVSSGGAAALNQVIERDVDARMDRTAGRPVPAGRIGSGRALAIGLALSALGIAWLGVRINTLTAVLSAATIGLYLAVYTPLKRRTSLNTHVGAVPGAIPPVMGWTAATGRIEPGAWALFGILYLWQFPHFLAIAWMYRHDYARGDLPMLPVVDPEGAATGRQVALYALALLPVSLLPTMLGLAGPVYFFGALAAGLVLLAFSLRMAFARDRLTARRLLMASVTYLPTLLVLLVIDRVRAG